MIVLAATDEETGEILPKARVLANFSLQEVGGPPVNEKPDATGLFSDGRFLDFSGLKNRDGRPANFQNNEQNRLHSLSAPKVISWAALAGQFGAGIKLRKHFKPAFAESVALALAVLLQSLALVRVPSARR